METPKPVAADDSRFAPRYTIDSRCGSGTFTFTHEGFTRFKSAFTQAVQHQQTEFKFGGCVWVIGFARYVVEYLDGKFSGQRVVH